MKVVDKISQEINKKKVGEGEIIAFDAFTEITPSEFLELVRSTQAKEFKPLLKKEFSRENMIETEDGKLWFRIGNRHFRHVFLGIMPEQVEQFHLDCLLLLEAGEYLKFLFLFDLNRGYLHLAKDRGLDEKPNEISNDHGDLEGGVHTND